MTNSSARAERGQALLTAALEELVRTPLTKIETVEQAMASRLPGTADPPEEIPIDVQAELVRVTLDKHYREALDQRLACWATSPPAPQPKRRMVAKSWPPGSSFLRIKLGATAVSAILWDRMISLGCGSNSALLISDTDEPGQSTPHLGIVKDVMTHARAPGGCERGGHLRALRAHAPLPY